VKKNNTLYILLLFFTQLVLGQTNSDKLISARIVVDSTNVENVNIVNTRSEKTSVSDKNGYFQINVKVGDVLVLTAVNLETRSKKINEEDLKTEIVILKMTPKVTQLKEVNVNDNANINAENLRIIPKGQKQYSPAERKLYTDKSGLLDPLLNKISGRTTMLKKEVQVERNEKLLLKLDGYYEDNYYIDVLKIPKEYIKGFQYYLIEDEDFVKALEAKNKTMTLFLVKRLAANYNQILSNEK
jgi:hypothetical protein